MLVESGCYLELSHHARRKSIARIADRYTLTLITVPLWLAWQIPLFSANASDGRCCYQPYPPTDVAYGFATDFDFAQYLYTHSGVFRLLID
jgi:hypothetical protein